METTSSDDGAETVEAPKKHEVSEFERAVRRGAVIDRMQRRFRRIKLTRSLPGLWLYEIYLRRDKSWR